MVVKVKAGDNGRVFGSVSTKAIAEEFEKQFWNQTLINVKWG